MRQSRESAVKLINGTKTSQMKDVQQKKQNLSINGRGGTHIKNFGKSISSVVKTPNKSANMKAIVYYMNEIENINNSMNQG
jgi:hypothetical protein